MRLDKEKKLAENVVGKLVDVNLKRVFLYSLNLGGSQYLFGVLECETISLTYL